MQTAGSGPESPSIVIFAKLQATASGHPGNLGFMVQADDRCIVVAAQRAGRARKIAGQIVRAE